VDTPAAEPLLADRVERFRHQLPHENLHAVIARLAKLLPRGPGVLVTNDWLELAMAGSHDTGRGVVAIVHGDYDYYSELARRHEATIDAFVAYSSRIADRLRTLLPSRADAVFRLRYGVDVPEAPRDPSAGPLRALFVGRLDRQKGIFDLAAIAEALAARGQAVIWTVVGTGPEEAALRKAWPDPAVRWLGARSHEETVRVYARHDVLVLPSYAEGLPVVLLEAAAAGVVPVVSELPSGVPEVVDPGVTGFRAAPGDILAFVEAIERLAGDPLRLAAMSQAVRDHVTRSFDARVCASAYDALYERVMASRRPWQRRRMMYGSRLDKSWIPNGLVKAFRRPPSPAPGA
jgi:glycosyltransferase involved in cell wall biosynthesis